MTCGACQHRDNMVVRVIDGDTIVVQVNGHPETVRLIGVDTPETKDPRKPVEYFGKEASRFTASPARPRPARTPAPMRMQVEAERKREKKEKKKKVVKGQPSLLCSISLAFLTAPFLLAVVTRSFSLLSLACWLIWPNVKSI